MVELVFMMFVLKLPIVYLGLVCWWAVRAEPAQAEPAGLVPAEPWPSDGPPRPRLRSPRRGPHGSPVRSYARTRRATAALR